MNSFMNKKLFLAISLAILVLSAFAAFASADEATANRIRAFYGIGHVNAEPVPIVVYIAHGKELIRAGTINLPAQVGLEGPRGMVVDSKNERIYLAHESSHYLDTIDARTLEILAPTYVEAENPAGMTIDNATGRLYITDGPGSSVYVYDTDTMSLIDQWELPISEGPGAFGIAYADGRLFTGQLSDQVRYYGVDTYDEKGIITINDIGVAIAAVDDPTPILFSTKGRYGTKLTRYDVDKGIETSVETGVDLRGLRANPDDGVVYVLGHRGSLMSREAGVWAFDIDSMEEVSYDIFGIGDSWSATDCAVGAVDIGSLVTLSMNSKSGTKVNVGDELRFTATFNNDGDQDIHVLPARLLYDADRLLLVSATPAPNSSEPGEISWNDLIALDGSDLPFGESLSVEVTFMAKSFSDDCSADELGYNIAAMSGAKYIDGTDIDDAAGSASFIVTCPSMPGNGGSMKPAADSDEDDESASGCGC